MDEKEINNILIGQLKQLRKISKGISGDFNDGTKNLIGLSNAMSNIAIAIKTKSTSSDVSRQDAEKINELIEERLKEISKKAFNDLYLS